MMICRRKLRQILVLKTNKKYQMIIKIVINIYLTLMLQLRYMYQICCKEKEKEEKQKWDNKITFEKVGC